MHVWHSYINDMYACMALVIKRSLGLLSRLLLLFNPFKTKDTFLDTFLKLKQVKI